MVKLLLLSLLCLSAFAQLEITLEWAKHDEWACKLNMWVEAKSYPATDGSKGAVACFAQAGDYLAADERGFVV
jgi:hypothetical protein